MVVVKPIVEKRPADQHLLKRSEARRSDAKIIIDVSKSIPSSLLQILGSIAQTVLTDGKYLKLRQ